MSVADQEDRAAEALWRSEADRKIDWLEAPRRERNEALRRARAILRVVSPAPTNEVEQLRSDNAVLAQANIQLKTELIHARADVWKAIDRRMAGRIRELHAKAAAEEISKASRKGLHQRAEELGAALGDLRAIIAGERA
jgi:hypothetical protein